MIVILVAGHHAGGDLLAHIAHLPVNNQSQTTTGAPEPTASRSNG